MSDINYELKALAKRFTINANIIRRNNRLSKRGMARAVGVSDSTIRRIDTARKTGYGKGEQGYIPTLGTIVKVANAVGCTPGELLMTKL